MCLQSSQPPEAKRRRSRTLESQVFQIKLNKAWGMKNRICILEITNSQSEIQSQTHRNIETIN